MRFKLVHYIIWGLVVALFWPTLANLYQARWSALSYTHAYFILPVSLWLVWRRRQELGQAFAITERRFGLISLFVFVFGVLLYVFGWNQDYMVISTFALIPFLYGFVGFVYGARVRRLVLFPILYLILLVPPPFALLDQATLPLRYISAFGAEKVFRVFGVPIQREGLSYVIGAHQMMIDQACSGFRSLITMFSLGLVYVYVFRSSLLKKTVLVASIVPLAIMGNVLRIITISLIGINYGPEAASGFMHSFSGAVIFLFIVLGFVGIEGVWTKVARKSEDEEFEWFE